MSPTRIRRVLLTVATSALATALFTIMGASPASAHGYVNGPDSRALHCKQGTVTDCGPVQWDPQSVEGPKGFPSAGPADGTLCAGGNEAFATLDDPRGGSWPKTDVSSGATLTFSWHLTAAHATTDFSYYITKDGWDPSQPLTRDALELEPFLTVPFDGQQPPSDVSHDGVLPQRSGHHVILAVWTVHDTANAFYQCSDLNFG